MKRTDFHYHLPESLIAQEPVEPRDASRMLVMNRATETIRHKRFNDIVDLIPANTCLVVNNTKVFPARLHLEKAETGAMIEIFLLRQLDAVGKQWRCLVRPSKRVKPGTELAFPDGEKLVVETVLGEGVHEVSVTGEAPFDRINRFGETPLPPYIKREIPKEEDKTRYQTVFAEKTGAVAAPTAGFHFTDRVLGALEKKGVPVFRVTLYVGLGTFRPVSVDDIRDHQMDIERYEIDDETAEALNAWKGEGGKVMAVGTTAVRTLEGCMAKHGSIRPVTDETDIFIYPPYEFRFVDSMLTNFHLPESTLIMLVSAFANREFVLDAYREAVEQKYRFYSYGDCMLIL